MPAYNPLDVQAVMEAGSNAEDLEAFTALHEEHTSALMRCPHDGPTAAGASCRTTR